MPQPKRAKKSADPTPTQNPPVKGDPAVIEETLLGISRRTPGKDLASPEEIQALLDDIVLLTEGIPLMRNPTGYTPNPALERAQDLIYRGVRYQQPAQAGRLHRTGRLNHLDPRASWHTGYDACHPHPGSQTSRW